MVTGVGQANLQSGADGVCALTSVENYRHLVVDRGWPPKDYESWLCGLLSLALRPGM